MSESKIPATLEKSIRKTLWRRRTMTGAGVLAFLSLLAGIGYFVWQDVKEPPFVPPSYDLDPDSETYWRDRTQADIDALPKSESPARRMKIVHPRLWRTVSAARKLGSSYQKIMAITDIATTLAVNDENFGIDNILREFGETPFAQSMYGRILISQALMYLRLNNQSAARVAFQEYRRISIEADLKLDSDLNKLSFIGAVNVLSCLSDTGQLAEMFNRQFNFSLRVIPSQQATAFRTLAGEQARAGMPIPALNTIRRIANPVERVRAYQLLIALSARPPKIEPVEPVFEQIKTEGPWEPELNPTVTRQVIGEVFAQIAELEALDSQINLLMRLAGSQLMCDPEIHRIFKQAVEESSFDELIRRPVVKLLTEPESSIIRNALGMPPAARPLRRNVDPALDDWSTPYGTVSVDMIEVAPETLQTLNDVQTIRTLLMTAQSYQMVARYRDAGDVLNRAAPLARRLSLPVDRITYLLMIGEKQISAGRVSEAREALQAVGLPTSGESRDVLTTERLSTLARLQTMARFFDDALATIVCIENAERKDDDLAFLATEQIRIQRFDDAQRTLSQMTSTRGEELQHLTAIGRGGGEEHYSALGIPFPDSQNRDIDLRRSCETLFRNGLYGVAEKALEKIVDSEARVNLQQRIVQEYMLLFGGYRGDNDRHREIRGMLLRKAWDLAGNIENVQRRATLFVSIVTDALPYARDDESVNFLQTLYENALETCRRFGSNNEEKAELFGKLLSAKLELTLPRSEGTERNPHDPMSVLDRNRYPALYDGVMALVGETLKAVNDAEDGLPRGNAISRLAQILARIGRTRDANKMIEEARETARNITRPRDSVTVLLSLIPTLRFLGDEHTIKEVYRAAFVVTSNSFVDATLNAEKLYEWRVRDSELDRIVRSQLENDLLVDAVEYSVRIEENLLRERLLRTTVYIYLDRNDLAQAESLLQRIKLPEIRSDTARDVLFTKRTAEKTATPPIGEESHE